MKLYVLRDADLSEHPISASFLPLSVSQVALCVMNPFGDDDEDFQTSDILDYNLEVSFRSVYMDGASFPQYLTFPFGKKAPDNSPEDLERFLEDIDCDLNKQMEFMAENK